MAGKPATISDLFSPMSSIKTCIDSHGTNIENGISEINDSVLQCAGTLTSVNYLLSAGAKTIKKTVIDSIKSLNDITQKQVKDSAGVSSGLMSGVAGSIGTGFAETNKYINIISQQITELIRVVRYGKSNKNDFVTTTNFKKYKVPNISGGNGVGELAAVLANAAMSFNKISYLQSIQIKKKSKRIIGGLLDIFKEYDKELTDKKMKHHLESVEYLSGISKNIGDISKNMAGYAGYSLIAIIGVKLTKYVIKGLINTLNELENPKDLKQKQKSIEILEGISNNIVSFEKNMALATLIGGPAILGTVISKFVIKTALSIFKPLGKKDKLEECVEGAENLENIATSILKFDAAMALSVVLAVPAGIGVLMSAFIIRGAVSLFSVIGNKRTTLSVMNATRNIELMCLSFITFTLSMLTTTMIMKYLLFNGGDKLDPTNLVSLGGSVLAFGLMIGAATLYRTVLGSKRTTQSVILGSYSIMLMSTSFVLFSIALLTSTMITKSIIGSSLKDGKFDFKDVASIASIAPTFLLMLGAYALYQKLGSKRNVQTVINGGLAVIMMSVSFVAFVGSFWIAHQITKNIIGNWDSKKDPFALIMDVAMLGLMLVSFKLYQSIGKDTNTKKTLNGGLSIILMSVSFVVFSSALWLANKTVGDLWKKENGKLDVTSMFTSVAIFGLMFVSSLVFKNAGINFTTISKGTAGVALMAVGIAAFGFGVGFYTNSIKGAKNSELLNIPILLGLFGVEFVVAGKMFKNISLGTMAVVAMSVGVGVFGFAVGVYVDSIKNANWKEIGKMAALIGIFGVEFGLIGIPVVAASVALGSVAIITASAAIAVFGNSIKKFIEPIQNTDTKTLKSMIGLIGAVGLEFAAIGLPVVAPFIAIGASALIVAGGAVLVLANAMKEWTKVELDVDKLNLLCTSIDRIKLAFQGNPNGNKKGGFLKKLGDSISGAIFAPFDSAVIATSAASLVVAGKAINSLSTGLKEWMNSGFTDVNQLDFLCLSIDRIKLAFQGNPNGSKAEKQRFLSKIKGNISGALDTPFDLLKMKTTARALMIAGHSIKSLSKDLIELSNSNIDTIDLDSLITVIIKMRDLFGQMGEKKNGNKSSLIKKIIGVDLSNFENTDVERGAKSVRKMGKSLIDISKGLLEFYNGVGSKFKDPKFMDKFAMSVANVVGSLSSAFATVASSENIIERPVTEANTWFGKIFQDLTVNTFGAKNKNRVEEGIKSVKYLGTTIKDIAIGLKEFKNIVPSGNTAFIKDVAAGISALLNGIQEPLIAFGTTDESFNMVTKQMSEKATKYGVAISSIHDISANTLNFEKHKVDVSSAMKNIGQIGNLVKGLAEGVKILSSKNIIKDLGKSGVVDAEFNVSDDASGMIGNIQRLVCSQVGVFLQLGKHIKEVGMSEVFEDRVVQDVSNGIFNKRTKNKSIRVSKGEKSYVAIAIEAAAGIGSVITGLADGYAKMNDTFPTEEKMIEGVSRVSKAIVAIMGGFSTIGYALVNGGAAWYKPMVPPEFEGKFPNVPGWLANLVAKNASAKFEEASKNISVVIEGFNKSVSGLVNKKSEVIDFSDNANSYMESIMNVASMTYVLSDHIKGVTVSSYQNKQIITYALDEFNSGISKTANVNIKNITSGITHISKALPVLSEITPNSGNSFVNFSMQLVRGINILAGAHTNISTATNFIKTLHSAVKNNVFDNISKNTQLIANAINSIDNDNFKPYADMIAALGKMTESHRAFISMQKELYDLLKKIIDEINSVGKSDNSNLAKTPVAENTQRIKNVGNNINVKGQQQQTVIAKLDRNSVQLDAGDFLRDFEGLLKKYNL